MSLAEIRVRFFCDRLFRYVVSGFHSPLSGSILVKWSNIGRNSIYGVIESVTGQEAIVRLMLDGSEEL